MHVKIIILRDKSSEKEGTKEEGRRKKGEGRGKREAEFRIFP